MLAHLNGQTADYSKLAKSLGVSAVTVKNYIDLLESTFMVDVMPPYFSNLGKRLVKAPKIYITDSGITSTLLELHNFEEMAGHPSFGSIWEQIVLSNMKELFPEASFYFYRTSNGAEVDFVMKIKELVFTIECKASVAPKLSKGHFYACQDIHPSHSFVAAPIKKGWAMKPKIDVVSLSELETKLRDMTA